MKKIVSCSMYSVVKRILYILCPILIFSLGQFFLKDGIERLRLPHVVCKPNTVVFDLNDVLFHIPSSRALKHLGVGGGFKFWKLWGTDAKKALVRIFDFLCQIRNESLIIVDENARAPIVPTCKNLVMPTLMQDWMRGELQTDELVALITEALENNKDFFVNTNEKKVFKKLFKIFFDPHVRAQLYRPIKEGVALLKRCKKQGYTVILLSNIDGDIVPLLEQKYPEIFELFDGIVLSADVGLLKPDPAIYKHVLKTYNLNPKSTYFFDDEPINITGASQLGIQGVVFDSAKTTTADFIEKIAPLELKA
jgi:HAD superfamily hydrolase (TIGR01509 family)